MRFSFGGLTSPSLAESLSALYVVYIGLQLDDPYYKFIFILNGLTAAISHSPFMYKNYPKFRDYVSYLDSVSIYYVMLLYPLKSYKFYLFLGMILIDLIFNNKLYNIVLSNKLLSMLPTIIILFNKGFLKNNFLILVLSLIAKYYENIKLTRDIKLHSIWHILGAHMFKEMVYI